MEMMCQEYLTIAIPCRMCGMTQLIRVKSADYVEWTLPNRRHVQDVFPYLSASDREMFITQTCEDCWKKIFDNED